MSATISDCGRYRYTLHRELDELGGECVLFVMLNPSTADASEDDPTIRRCIGYARDWGYSRLAVGNLYAYRATQPKELYRAKDPVGPENDEWLSRLADDATLIVAAWGADTGPVLYRPSEVLAALGQVYCLAFTGSGQPRHPLYLARDLTPRPLNFSEVSDAPR